MRDSQLDLRHLASIVQFSEDAIIGKTLDFTVVSWNAAAERLYGYSATEMIGQSIAVLFPSDRTAEEETIRQRLLNGEVLAHYETERIRKGGQRIPVSITVSPIRDARGQVVGASAVARDITAQKRVEAEHQLLAAIVESSEDAIFAKTLDGTITSWNRGAENLYGYAAAEALGQSVTMLIPPERPSDFGLIMSRIRNGEGVEQYQTVRQRKDGTRLDISLSVSPLRDQWGTVIGASAIARDVSESKRVELALLQSEARFRRLVDTAPGAILIIDDEGHIVQVNDRVETLFGYGPDELLGRSVEVLLPAHFRKSHVTYRQDYFAQPSARLMGSGRDLAGQRKDGSIFPVEIGLSYLPMDSGLLAMAFVTDISERKRAEEERALLRQREQAAHLEAERSKFEERERFAMELHDGVIQSIYAVGMGLELGRATLVNEARLDDLLVNSVRDLDRVIEELRRYIRDLKGGGSYTQEFRRQLEALAERFQDSSSAQLVMAIPDVLMFLAEEQMHPIVQLFSEALSNIARHAHATKVHVALTESPAHIVMTVTDDGVGFNPETVELGSGLTNMRRRALQLNGTLDIASQFRQRTTLTFTFPVLHTSSSAEQRF